MSDMNTTKTTYPTLFDLFQQWANSGYPDYVTGVWSNDGSSYNLTVGVVDGAAGEAGKQEILDLIENDVSVTFTTQTYSRNYLSQIQDELLPYFKQELGMVATGVSEIGNCVDVEFLTEKANDEITLSFIAELKETYGDAISVSYTEGYALLETADKIDLGNPLVPSAPGGKSLSPLLVAGLIGIPLLVFGTWFALRKRFVPVMQATTGSTVTPTDTISVKEVKEMVKESSLAVSKEVDERVLKILEHPRK